MVHSRLEPVKLSDIDNGCMLGTREKILEDIDTWIQSGEKNILWIIGQPGSGKTSIAASIFQKHERRCARFFFKRDIERLCKPGNVWRSIAWRLAELYPEMLFQYAELVQSNSSYVQDNDLEKQFAKLIEDPLKKLYTDGNDASPIILFDALDECDSGEEFNKFLQTLHTWSGCSKGPRLIVTSRDYQNIRTVICPISNIIELNTGENVDEVTSSDIHTYLVARFHNLDMTGKWPGEFKIKELTTGTLAAGLFIWARIALDYLGTSLHRAKQRLLDVPGNLGSQQKNLDSLYQQVLKVAFESLEKEAEREEQMCVLCAIISVKDPLSPAVIAQLLNLPIESVQDVARNLSAVIPHDLKLDHPLRVCHKSFSDFLYDQPPSSYLHIDISKAHHEIAEGCLDVMMKELKFNICDLETSYLLNDEVEGLDLRISERITPQLEYSSLYWADHVADVQRNDILGTTSSLANKVYQVISEHLLHWFEVLSLLKAVDIASEMLLTCAIWSRVCKRQSYIKYKHTHLTIRMLHIIKYCHQCLLMAVSL
jgi:energy-coupling factor transporter ATP-binding protein EcfA2